MHPEVRGKFSAAGSWGAIPAATLVAAALRPKPPGKGKPAPGASHGGTKVSEKELNVVRSREEGDAQTPWGELQCLALLLAGGSLCSQRSAGVPGAEGDTSSLSPGSMGYDDAEEISLAHPREDTKAVTELGAQKSLSPRPGEPIPAVQVGAAGREERSVQLGEP